MTWVCPGSSSSATWLTWSMRYPCNSSHLALLNSEELWLYSETPRVDQVTQPIIKFKSRNPAEILFLPPVLRPYCFGQYPWFMSSCFTSTATLILLALAWSVCQSNATPHNITAQPNIRHEIKKKHIHLFYGYSWALLPYTVMWLQITHSWHLCRLWC